MIDVHDDNGCQVIIPKADIVSEISGQLRTKMNDLLNAGKCKKIRFDFSKVTNLDSEALYVFCLIPDNILNDHNQTSLEIININSDIANLFKYTHLNKYYHLSEVKKTIT